MRALWFVGLMVAAACGSPQRTEVEETGPVETEEPGPASVDAGFVNRGPGVWLRVNPTDAELIVDGESAGLATKLDATEGFLALEPGLHQIVVRKEGYKTWRAEVAVRADTEPIDIVLERAVIAD